VQVSNYVSISWDENG